MTSRSFRTARARLLCLLPAACLLLIAPLAPLAPLAWTAAPSSNTGAPPSRSAALPAALLRAMPEMRRTLERIRGHAFRSTVPMSTIDEADVRAYLERKLKRDYPDEKIAQEQKTYVHFGFLKPDQDLKDLFLQMLTEQAAGFYDPDAKRLFLVGGRSLPGIALVHELAHALQDQTFPVGPIIDRSRDNDDALLAVQSMIEGEAMALSSQYASIKPEHEDLGGQPSPGEAPERTAQESQRLLGRMPEVLQANLMFPYTKGMAWAGAVVAGGGEAMMDEMYRHPPESSEQILHPEKIRTPRDVPSVIAPFVLADLAAPLSGSGYLPVKTNTLGEFNIAQLFGGMGDQQAVSAASGWDGDLYEVVEKPGAGTAMVWVSVWDSADDAAEFRARAESWLRPRHPDGVFTLGSPAGAPRAVLLIEGFEPALAARLGRSAADALARGVTWR